MDRPVTGFHAIISSMSLLLHKHSQTLAMFETLPTIGCTQVKEMTDWKKTSLLQASVFTHWHHKYNFALGLVSGWLLGPQISEAVSTVFCKYNLFI
jgi:hypothetical protein